MTGRRAFLTGLLIALAWTVAPGGSLACRHAYESEMPGVHEWLRKARASGHPLAGHAFETKAPSPPVATSCDAPDALFEVIARLAALMTDTFAGGRQFLLVGEVHDNGTHHDLRAELLRRIRTRHQASADKTRPYPGIVFEHIRADQRPALDLFAALSSKGQHLDRPAELFRFLKWDQSGWPDKSLFYALFRAVIEGRHPIFPGDPPRDMVRQVARQGASALGPEEVARLGLDQPLAPALQDALLDELEASHCGLMPKAAFSTMAEAQRFRDAHLAEALVAAAARHGSAILFAGNGHVRADRGVPLVLRRREPARNIVTVLLLEVEPDKTDPAAYVQRDTEGRPTSDFIVLTPRAERGDPCVAMRERFKPRDVPPK